MNPTRRTVLKGVGGVIGGGALLSGFQTEIVSAMSASLESSTGAAVAIGVSEETGLTGFSETVSVRAAPDPAASDDDSEDADDVLHITSLPEYREDGSEESAGDDEEGGETDEDETSEEDAAVTYDYGISLLDVQHRDLTVSDIHEYGDDGDDEGSESDGGAGLAYDWYVTDDDVVGVGTDHEQTGGPDEVWLLLEDADEGSDSPGRSDTGGGNNGEGRGRGRGPPSTPVDDLTLVFRTLYADEATGEWHTRTVSEEFQGIEENLWKRASVDQLGFEAVGTDLVAEYGDATVQAAGVGRGDPFYGPSVLDTYYRDFRLNGQSYTLPVATPMVRSDSTDEE